MQANAELKVHSVEEIEAKKGHYDDDGFYILDEGGFFDDHGYFFNKDGFNSVFGFYDPGTGEYINPADFDPDYIEALKFYFTELGFDSDEEEGSDQEVEEYDYEFTNNAVKIEHCVPAIRWLEE